ncbi:MAG TPA: DUF2303 family protein [Burkholderiaceae bacterium]|nr:DUF2303 family protein [Burkholderiaceae bacterium]
MEDSTIINDAAALGTALAQPRTTVNDSDDPSIPFVVVPEGYEVHDLERLFPVPARKKGTIEFRDAGSFCRAVKDSAEGGATKLYGNPRTPSFKAVFNDHGSEPGWQDHIATYACPLSIEWKTWMGNNKKQVNQEVFAQFIEDNSPDCAVPSAADMIEISRTLEAKKKVNFASGIRLSNGQTELTYEEEVTGTAAKGRLTIPEIFTLGIPVLEGGPRYAVEARLRYRIADGGKLTLWYDLLRPHKVLEDAAAEVWKLIEDTTGFKVLNGG